MSARIFGAIASRTVPAGLRCGCASGLKHAISAISSRHTRLSSTKVNYEGHIPLDWAQNVILTAGAAYMSLTDPRRGGE